MIKSIEINNFKSLTNFHLNGLSQISLFGGKNNAGKTTILEALFLFYDRMNPNMFLRQLSWRGVNEVALSSDAMFAPFFKDFDLNNSIQIRIINKNNSNESLSIKYNNSESRIIKVEGNKGQIKTDGKPIALHSVNISYRKNESREEKANLAIEQEGMSMEFVNFSKPSIDAVFLGSKSHTNPNENAIRFGELDVKGQAQPIIEYLKIIEPNLTSLSSIALSNNTSMLYGDIGIGTKVPISYMGDGTSRLLSILLAIASTRNGIVFIDEIENGIHYSTLHKIWKVIGEASKEYNCQIIATTHSYENLDAAVRGIPEEAKKDFKYFRFEKNNDSRRIVPKEFDYDVLNAAVERGWEVR